MPARAFVGIPLTDDYTHALETARERLLDVSPSWAGEKWVASENLHVTLLFIGQLADSLVGSASDALAEAADAIPEFDLELSGLRAVPSSRRARMIWAELADPSGRCAALAASIAGALEPFDAERDEGRPFRAHITLARARTPRPVAAEAIDSATTALLASGASPVMSVRGFTLYASTLGRHGPTYESLAEIPLGDA